MKIHRVVPLVLVILGYSLCSIAQRSGADSRFPQSSALYSTGRDSGSISGVVQDTNNSPLKEVRVELVDAYGMVMKDAYTNSSGAFEFSPVPRGNYDVVATSGVQQARTRVDVTGWTTSISLRMPSGRPQDGIAGSAISVAQYKVPSRARDEYRKARDLLEKGKAEDARKHLEKAILICPDYAEGLTFRAVLELDEHKTEAATADLDHAIQADGNYAMAYMVLGSALSLQLKFDDALRALQHGESLAPDYWQLHFEMGKAYIGKADYPAALRELDRARNMTPTEYPLIYLLQANALLAMKEYPEAMTALRIYLEKDPQGPNSDQARKMMERAQALVD